MEDWDTGGLKVLVSELLPDIEQSQASKENGKQSGRESYPFRVIFILPRGVSQHRFKSPSFYMKSSKRVFSSERLRCSSEKIQFFSLIKVYFAQLKP